MDRAPQLSNSHEANKTIDVAFQIEENTTPSSGTNAEASMHLPEEELVTRFDQPLETNALEEDTYTTAQFESDIQKYLAFVEELLRYHKLIGIIRYENGHDPKLQDVFVPPLITFQDETSRETKHDSIVNVLERAHYVILLGDPVSGKSTLLRYLAWSHAYSNLATSSTFMSNISILPEKPIPLRIELRIFTEFRKQGKITDFLSYAIWSLKRNMIDIPIEMFIKVLRQKKMLLLLDGLNEVATLYERQALITEIESFALRYPGNYILVASRPVGYDLTPFSPDQYTPAFIQALSDKQIWQFLEHWYTYVLDMPSPLPSDAQQELAAFYTTLQENAWLRPLAANPLLITVIIALHRYAALPEKRVTLYDRCAELLLYTWPKLKGTDTHWEQIKMGKLDQRSCVAHLGYVLHASSNGSTGPNPTHKVGRFSRIFLLREIERFLEEQQLLPKVEQRIEAELFLEFLRVEAGLIVEQGVDEKGEPSYGFVLRVFQEYFAAVDVHERFATEDDINILLEFLRDHLHDPYWHEVILLLLGKLRSKLNTRLLEQILEGSVKSLWSQYTDIVQQDLLFVCSCLAEGIVVEEKLAEMVISRLSDVLKNSPFPSQQEEMLKALHSLMQTRQYTTFAQKALIALTSETTLETRAQIIERLPEQLSKAAIDQQITQLLELIQQPDFPLKSIVQAIEAFFENLSQMLEVQQQIMSST